MGVQRVGGLVGEHGPSRAAVGQADRLEDLVGAVRDEHVGRPDAPWHLGALDLGDPGAQGRRAAVGVAVPRDAAHRDRERLGERLGRRIGRLVGVQPDPHVDLRASGSRP